MSAYEALLRQNPQEVDLLLKELLIGVTSFFRDATAVETARRSFGPHRNRRARPATRRFAGLELCLVRRHPARTAQAAAGSIAWGI